MNKFHAKLFDSNGKLQISFQTSNLSNMLSIIQMELNDWKNPLNVTRIDVYEYSTFIYRKNIGVTNAL